MLSKIKSSFKRLAIGVGLSIGLAVTAQAQNQLFPLTLAGGSSNAPGNFAWAGYTNYYNPAITSVPTFQGGSYTCLSFSYNYLTNAATGVSTPALARIYTSLDNVNWFTNAYVIQLPTNNAAGGVMNSLSNTVVITNLQTLGFAYVAIGAIENNGNAASTNAGAITNIVVKALNKQGF